MKNPVNRELKGTQFRLSVRVEPDDTYVTNIRMIGVGRRSRRESEIFKVSVDVTGIPAFGGKSRTELLKQTRDTAAKIIDAVELNFFGEDNTSFTIQNQRFLVWQGNGGGFRVQPGFER